jgi:hypothetical protein
MTAIMGRPVKMPNHCRCGSNIGIVGPGSGPHLASVHCRNCNKHRAWLSKHTAQWLEAVSQKFGAPEIISLRTNGSALSCG